MCLRLGRLFCELNAGPSPFSDWLDCVAGASGVSATRGSVDVSEAEGCAEAGGVSSTRACSGKAHVSADASELMLKGRVANASAGEEGEVANVWVGEEEEVASV